MRPRVETLLVGRCQRDGVEAALGIGELRFEPRKTHDGESIARLGIERPAIDGQMALDEVRVDVFGRVKPREVDPRLVARLGIQGPLDEDADFG
jgi:hypothetical protein